MSEVLNASTEWRSYRLIGASRKTMATRIRQPPAEHTTPAYPGTYHSSSTHVPFQKEYGVVVAKLSIDSLDKSS